MTISFGSASSGVQAGINSVLYRAPAALAAGDIILWCVTNKYPTNGPAAPTGLTQLLQAQGGAGSAGVDSGNVYGTVFSRISDGTEDGATETVSVAGGNSVTSRSLSYARTAGSGWAVATSYGAQNTAADTWSVSSAAPMALAAGDKLVIVIAQNGDGDINHNTYALSASGLTFSALTPRHGTSSALGTTNGDDCAMRVLEADVNSGSGTATLNFSFNLTGSAGSSAGVVLFIRLREDPVAPTVIDFTGTVPTLTGAQGTAFSQSLASYFSGGLTPFAYNVHSGGALPAGLTLDPDTATIEGTPTVGGTFGPYVIRGRDTALNADYTNAFYIALSSNPSADLGYYTVAQTSNPSIEHTTVSHSFHHGGSWWTMLRSGSNWNLYQESGAVPGSPGATVNWVGSAHLSAIHTSVNCSVCLDAPRNKAYVIGFSEGAATVVLRVLTYAAGAWTLTQSVNLTGTGGVGLGTSSTFNNPAKLSIGCDGNGVPYVVSGNKGEGGSAVDGVHLAWPDSAASLGGTWSSVNLDATAGTPTGDASGRFAGIVTQGGTSHIVIVYSHPATDKIKMARHPVETTLANYASGWTLADIETTLDTDNHVWGGVMSFGGNQVVVTLIKTGGGTPTGRLYCLTSQLGAGLTWTHKRHRVTNGPAEAGALQEGPSRPVGILDQINGDVYVVYHTSDSHPYGWVGYKKATLAALLAAANDTAVFDISVARNATPLINDESLNAAWNAKTPAHPISAGMSYAPITAAIAASNSAGDSIWWARISLAAGVAGLAGAAAGAGSASGTLGVVVPFVPATVNNWPDALRPAGVDWGLFVPKMIGRSAFDGSVQSTTLGPPRWFFTIDTGPLRRVELPQWEALIDLLHDGNQRLRVWDWRREAPLGVATGTPLVRVAATGTTLQTKGWTANVTGILLAGTYFSVNGELKRLVADASSNASGHATLFFRPPLRAQAAVDLPLTLVKPTAVFMLTDDRVSFAQQGARFPGRSLSFMEDLGYS